MNIVLGLDEKNNYGKVNVCDLPVKTIILRSDESYIIHFIRRDFLLRLFLQPAGSA
jgi:hypothetical protein